MGHKAYSVGRLAKMMAEINHAIAGTRGNTFASMESGFTMMMVVMMAVVAVVVLRMAMVVMTVHVITEVLLLHFILTPAAAVAASTCTINDVFSWR